MVTDQPPHGAESDAADIDACNPSYYTARGAHDATEQQMRADRAAAVRILDTLAQTTDQHERAQLSETLHALESRWRDHDCSHVRENWEYLCAAEDRWQNHPEAMTELYARTIIDLLDGADTDMSPVQWRSQRQARETAGQGPWSPIRDPLSAEAARSRPYWLANPAHTSYYNGRRAASWPEQVMRADFAWVYKIRRQWARAGTDLERQQLTEHMYVLAEPWAIRDDALGQAWREMRTLVTGTYRDYTAFTDAVEQIMRHPHDDGLFARNLDQVRELRNIKIPATGTDASRTPRHVASSASAAARTAELAQNLQPRLPKDTSH
ncbi:hypothetical protein [Nocardia carnea]|uniref:hypothetical protein n=1 Tax=Nocardia carnea TaxID=37328 RepID=UPI0002D9E7F9|nr:hypothetical protein [Nocardia carnea]